jgi:hypothetical protein
MARSTFTDAGIARAAQRLGVNAATVRAVAEIESNGSGFLPDGRPKILFERHVFHRLTVGEFTARAPDLCNPDPGGYEGGAAEYSRLYRALQLDPDASLQACSWGAFQIMGFNWKACGERSLYGFLMAAHHDMDAHLSLFVAFIVSKGLAPELQRRHWARFAEVYNGPAYRKNEYDTRLADAYARHA